MSLQLETMGSERHDPGLSPRQGVAMPANVRTGSDHTGGRIILDHRGGGGIALLPADLQLMSASLE